jgi:hypothetical protein
MRLDIEKRRKELKKAPLEFGRKVDAVAKELTGSLSPVEIALTFQEEEYKAEKERIKQAAILAAKEQLDERMRLLAEVESKAVPSQIQGLTDEEFAAVLRQKTEVHEHRQGQARIQAETEAKLAAERAAIEAAEAAKLVVERKALADGRAALDDERAAFERAKAELKPEPDIVARILGSSDPAVEPGPLAMPHFTLVTGDSDEVVSTEDLVVAGAPVASVHTALQLCFDALSRVEWITSPERWAVECPSCDCESATGHEDGCILHTALVTAAATLASEEASDE